MKKRFLALVMVVCLLGVSVVSGTLAYFTDTAEATNVFTVGDVDITLTEKFDVLDGKDGNPIVGKSEKTDTGVAYKNIMPTNYMKKNVTVTNEENPAYVRVVVVLNNVNTMNKSIDDWFETAFDDNNGSYTINGVTYTDKDKLVEAVYDDVFAGWGITYSRYNADFTGKDARFVITDAEKPSDLVIDVDTTREMTDYYEFGQTNMFGNDDAWAHNYAGGQPYQANNAKTGYYAAALNQYELAFVYYLAMDEGDSVTLFDGLQCPYYFNQENAKFFQNLEIKVYADAIQQEGFKATDTMTVEEVAFAALNEAHPMSAMRGGDIDKDPTIIVGSDVPNVTYTPVATAEELAEAIANGQSPMLTADITVDEPLVFASASTYAWGNRGDNFASEPIVLNLNNNTISAEFSRETGAVIQNMANLTIIDGTVENTAVNGSFAILNKGTMTLDDVTVVGSLSDITDGNYAAYAVATSGEGTEITLNNTDISGRGGLSVTNGSKATVNGGTIHIPENGWGHGVYADGTNTEVIINDIILTEGYDPSEGGSEYQVLSYNGAKVTINGGIFAEWDGVSGDMIVNATGAIVINGGTFSSDPSKFVADGHKVNQTIDGKYVVSTPVDMVISALEEGGNVTLTSDIALEANDIIKIPAGKEATLNLNGHTISGVSTTSTAGNLITVESGAELTISNGTVSFTATSPDTEWDPEGYPTYANNTLNVKGKLVIDGATIKNETNPGGASYAIDCYPGADLVINDGVVDGCGKLAIRLFANSNTLSTNVTINGGEIIGSRGIWIHLPSSNIANKRLVNLTINGGTITATKDTDLAIYSYSYGDSREGTNITITGGTFNGDIGFSGGQANNSTDREIVSITGGTFNGAVGYYLANDGWEDYNSFSADVTVTVDEADALVATLNGGGSVELTEDVKIDPAGMSSGYGTTGINVKNGQTVDGGGNVLDIKGAGGTWDSGINTTGGLIKNITVTGSFRGIFINHNSTYTEPVVLDNVIIDGTTYTISCDQGNNQGLIATNSTFNGWTSYAATLGEVSFTDCNFGEGNGYAFCRPYAPTTFTDCVFEEGYTLNLRSHVVLDNCYYGDTLITADNWADLANASNGYKVSLTINGIVVDIPEAVSLAEELPDPVQA